LFQNETGARPLVLRCTFFANTRSSQPLPWTAFSAKIADNRKGRVTRGLHGSCRNTNESLNRLQDAHLPVIDRGRHHNHIMNGCRVAADNLAALEDLRFHLRGIAKLQRRPFR
jgi:hypothetical protein